jgi:hypothetical protein
VTTAVTAAKATASVLATQYQELTQRQQAFAQQQADSRRRYIALVKDMKVRHES